MHWGPSCLGIEQCSRNLTTYDYRMYYETSLVKGILRIRVGTFEEIALSMSTENPNTMRLHAFQQSNTSFPA
jgi:hypothetical protein